MPCWRVPLSSRAKCTHVWNPGVRQTDPANGSNSELASWHQRGLNSEASSQLKKDRGRLSIPNRSTQTYSSENLLHSPRVREGKDRKQFIIVLKNNLSSWKPRVKAGIFLVWTVKGFWVYIQRKPSLKRITSTPMFTAALFKIARTCKQSTCPLTERWHMQRNWTQA